MQIQTKCFFVFLEEHIENFFFKLKYEYKYIFFYNSIDLLRINLRN